MQSFISRVASLVLGLILPALAPSPSFAQEPPKAVTEAIAGSPAPQGPAQVIVGAYINDIQGLDFKTKAVPSTSMSGSAGSRRRTSSRGRRWSS
jgi:hypothetical protein